MSDYLAKFKGIHPGIILDRELKKRGIAQRPLALSIGEHPQTLHAITKGKRNLPISIAIKIEEKLGWAEGSLAILQTYYEIETAKKKLKPLTPNLSLIRKSVFWDTDISQIDWERQKNAVIRRIMERGNELEIKEIKQFYGAAIFQAALKNSPRAPIILHANSPDANTLHQHDQ